MGAGSKTRPTNTGGGIFTHPPLGIPILILSIFYTLLLLGARPPPPMGGAGGIVPKFIFYDSKSNLIHNPYLCSLHFSVLCYNLLPFSCVNYQMTCCAKNYNFTCWFIDWYTTLYISISLLNLFIFWPNLPLLSVLLAAKTNGVSCSSKLSVRIDRALFLCIRQSIVNNLSFDSVVIVDKLTFKNNSTHYYCSWNFLAALCKNNGVLRYRNIDASKLIFFYKYHWFEQPEIVTCEQYKGVLQVYGKNCSNFSLVRPQYRGAHLYLTRINWIHSLSKTTKSAKLSCYDFYAREECQRYSSCLGLGEKFSLKYCMVGPRCRGAHFYPTSTNRTGACSKIIKFAKLSWYDFHARKICKLHFSSLGVGEKIFSKKIMVRPRFRGAHYYGTSISLTYARREKIFFTMFSLYDFHARKMCQRNFIGLDLGEKIFSKKTMVRPRYRGAHHYGTRISLTYARRKKIFFTMFSWYDLHARKICQRYFSGLDVGENFFSKNCMVRSQYHYSYYYLDNTYWNYLSGNNIVFVKGVFGERGDSCNRPLDGLIFNTLYIHRLLSYHNFRDIRYRSNLPFRPASPTLLLSPSYPLPTQVAETNFNGRG